VCHLLCELAENMSKHRQRSAALVTKVTLLPGLVVVSDCCCDDGISSAMIVWPKVRGSDDILSPAAFCSTPRNQGNIVNRHNLDDNDVETNT
jgi:hypothetical protein